MPACSAIILASTDSVMVMLAGASSADAMRGPSTRPWLNMWSASSSGRLACSGSAAAPQHFQRQPGAADGGIDLGFAVGLFARGQVARQFEGDLPIAHDGAMRGHHEAALKWTVDV